MECYASWEKNKLGYEEEKKKPYLIVFFSTFSYNVRPLFRPLLFQNGGYFMAHSCDAGAGRQGGGDAQ